MKAFFMLCFIALLLSISTSVFANPYGSNWFRNISGDTVVERNRSFYQSLAKSKPTALVQTKYTLIIAPHPDDEILCCTGVMRDLVANKNPFKIIYLTDGDAHSLGESVVSRQYGQQRRQESIQATKKLGIPKTDLIWLGFPDGFLSILGEAPLRSPYTNQNKTSQHTYRPSTDYTAVGLSTTLSGLMELYPPEAIYFPHRLKEKHADHKAAGQLVWSLINDPESLHHYQYTIHGNASPRTTLNRLKVNLIGLFKSQLHDDRHTRFMQQFAYREERFE